MEIKRAVTEVDSWNGAASNYESTEDYCKACLIDVNSAAGNTEKKQSHCMLPVKPPGSSNIADKALFAASGGRGISAVKKPSDVSQADWDSAIMKAAKTIVSGYKQMDREPPEGVMQMAGGEKEERALMFDQVYQKVYQWTYEFPGRPHFSTFFLEGEILFALFEDQGKLYRASVDVDEDGETLLMGDLQPVIHEFTPVNRSFFAVQRQKDGKQRFFMVAATAIVNKVGEIDSTKLFDDMIQRADSTGFYPKLDYWHCGEIDPRFEYGQFDFLAREGVAYVGSGLLDPDNPLSKVTERAVRKHPNKYGASIEYYRPMNRGIEYVPLGNGLEVVAYTEGLNTRISFLPVEYATNWYTSMTMEARAMEDVKLRALRTLFDGDDEEFEKYIAGLTGINREVANLKLVSRSEDPTKEPAQEPVVDPAKAPVVTPVTEPGEPQPEIVLDDDTLQQLVGVLRSQLETGVLKTVTEDLSKLSDSQTTLTALLNGMLTRLESLEQTEEQKQRDWKKDLPARTQSGVKITYRPRESVAEEPVTLTYADKAATVLDKFPKVGFKQ